MSGAPRQSTLHLQMGQEIIYFVCTLSVLAAFILALVALRAVEQVQAPSSGPQPAPSVELPTASLPIVESTPVNAEPPAGSGTTVAPPITTPSVPLVDKPPIITLSEAQGYYFELGSAALSQEFQARLRNEVVARLIQYAHKYDVDIIEVIGHTDEVPIRGRTSNLDQQLLVFLNGAASAPLIGSDNVGLGMARAASVVMELRRESSLAHFRMIPLSAGQAITEGEHISSGSGPPNVETRRRIEIRMRRRE